MADRLTNYLPKKTSGMGWLDLGLGHEGIYFNFGRSTVERLKVGIELSLKHIWLVLQLIRIDRKWGCKTDLRFREVSEKGKEIAKRKSF